MKFLALLKYLDRSKITPEAVAEIAAALNVRLSAEQTAEIANAYRTRGAAGLLPYAPLFVQAQLAPEKDDESDVLFCPHCGKCFLPE